MNSQVSRVTVTEFDFSQGASEDYSAFVAETTRNKIRSFLYEWAVGTRSYRSLHNLTEQVEHQYHGRFVIELIQNAHDALPQVSGNDSVKRRIEFCFREDGEFGTLYVANDGRPFSTSNFESVSQLGQSDKSPQFAQSHDAWLGLHEQGVDTPAHEPMTERWNSWA